MYTFGLNETDGASPLILHQKTVELTATNCSPTVPQLRVILSRRSKSTREGWRKRKPQEMGMFQEELRKQQVTFLLKPSPDTVITFPCRIAKGQVLPVR